MNQNVIKMFDYLYHEYNVRNVAFIKKAKFIKNLPKYLQKPGNKQSKMVTKLPNEVTEEHLLTILFDMHNGYEYMSFYYLDMKFGGIGGDPRYNYKAVKQEAYFIWRILKQLSGHSFIKNYLNDPIMSFIFQDKIELLILPSTSQFRFDKCFPNLNIILEINEYNHELPDVKANDEVKAALATLCGMSLSSLRIMKVFGMSKDKFRSLKNERLHELLNESAYLVEFMTKFEFKVLSALLRVDVIRNDYIIFSFVIILNEKLVFLQKRFINTFNETGVKSEADRILIGKIENMIDIVKTSDDVLKIFNLKEKCVKSNTGYAITFAEICDVLRFEENKDKDRIVGLVKFMFERTDMIMSINFDKTTKLFLWADLYTVVNKYVEDTDVKETLELYLLYVGETYETVVKMINSHSNSLISNKEILTRYIDHYDESTDKSKDVIIEQKNQVICTRDKTISDLNKMIKKYKNYFPKSNFDEDLNYTSNYKADHTIAENRERELVDVQSLYDSIIAIEIKNDKLEIDLSDLSDLEDNAEDESDLDDSD